MERGESGFPPVNLKWLTELDYNLYEKVRKGGYLSSCKASGFILSLC